MDSGVEGYGLEPQSTCNAHLYFIIDNFYDLYIVHMVCEGVTTHTAFRAQRCDTRPMTGKMSLKASSEMGALFNCGTCIGLLHIL